MTNIFKNTALWLLLLLSWLVLFGQATSAQTIQVPIEVWNELESNNNKALAILKVSDIPLTEAQNIISLQQSELTKLKDILKKQEEELKKAEAETVKLQNSLNETNNYLSQYTKEVKRQQTRLNRQKELYKWLFVVAGGIAIARR